MQQLGQIQQLIDQYQQLSSSGQSFQSSTGASGQFTSGQSPFQPGFAGTNAEEVRQQNQDQVIATDFLIATKTGVRNLTFALTESVTPEAREILREQLAYTIDAHEKISQYMMEKGYYHPSNLEDQLKVDLKTSKAALKLAK